ncbi:hypothetical protein V6Z11_A05G021500 [Gossypium hirsutum]
MPLTHYLDIFLEIPFCVHNTNLDLFLPPFFSLSGWFTSLPFPSLWSSPLSSFFYLFRGLASFFSAPILVVFSLLPFGLSGSLLHSPFRPWVLGLGFSSLCILFLLYFTKLSVQEVLLIGRAKRYLLKKRQRRNQHIHAHETCYARKHYMS